MFFSQNLSPTPGPCHWLDVRYMLGMRTSPLTSFAFMLDDGLVRLARGRGPRVRAGEAEDAQSDDR